MNLLLFFKDRFHSCFRRSVGFTLEQNHERVLFVRNRRTGQLPIHGEAGDKADLYRDRHQLLLQRLSRDKYFSRSSFDFEMSEAESCEVYVLREHFATAFSCFFLNPFAYVSRPPSDMKFACILANFRCSRSLVGKMLFSLRLIDSFIFEFCR